MAIADLKNVLSIFSGASPSAEEQAALFGEVLLMVLARASSSDANINPVEIKTIQRIIKERAGQDVSDVDIRKAGRTELYKSKDLQKYLRGVQSRLKAGDKAAIAGALADVIRSDTSISVLEIEFFNQVAEALALTPAELIGLAA